MGEVAPNSYFPVNAPEIAHHVHSPSKAIDQPASESAAKMERRGYYAAAAYSDFLLGTLLDEVDRLGLRDDTLVVMGSDHGWGLGEHNHWIKYTDWETDVRVPLFVRAPWKPNAMGQRTSAIVEQIDIYPSAAELAGIAVNKSEESIDGSSWAHLLDDPTATHLTSALAQYHAVGRREWKVIQRLSQIWRGALQLRRRTLLSWGTRCAERTGATQNGLSGMGPI